MQEGNQVCHELQERMGGKVWKGAVCCSLFGFLSQESVYKNVLFYAGHFTLPWLLASAPPPSPPPFPALV